MSATSLRSCSYACGNYIDIKGTGKKEKAFSVWEILDKNGVFGDAWTTEVEGNRMLKTAKKSNHGIRIQCGIYENKLPRAQDQGHNGKIRF